MFRRLMLLILISVSSTVMAFSYTLEITEQELQNKLSSFMPLERKLLVFSIILSDPKITLIQQTNKIGLFTNLSAVAPDGSKSTGRVNITGTLSYNPEQGAFYFKNPVIENLELDKLPEQYSTDIKQLTQLAVSHALSTHPVYKLKDDDLRQKYIKSTLESVTVDQGKLLVTLKPF